MVAHLFIMSLKINKNTELKRLLSNGERHKEIFADSKLNESGENKNSLMEVDIILAKAPYRLKALSLNAVVEVFKTNWRMVRLY